MIGDLTDTAVYRIYDHAGVLLYVGLTTNPRGRFKLHAKDKEWWPETDTYKLHWYSTALEAEIAEQYAIVEEGPLHNRNLPPWRLNAPIQVNREHCESMEQAQAEALKCVDEGQDVDAVARRLGWSPAFLRKLAASTKSQRMCDLIATVHKPEMA